MYPQKNENYPGVWQAPVLEAKEKNTLKEPGGSQCCALERAQSNLQTVTDLTPSGRKPKVMGGCHQTTESQTKNAEKQRQRATKIN